MSECLYIMNWIWIQCKYIIPASIVHCTRHTNFCGIIDFHPVPVLNAVNSSFLFGFIFFISEILNGKNYMSWCTKAQYKNYINLTFFVQFQNSQFFCWLSQRPPKLIFEFGQINRLRVRSPSLPFFPPQSSFLPHDT